MESIELICPPAALVREATRYFEPFHKQISVLSEKSANLRRTRDLLLPRLLSGQIAFEAAEAEEVAA